MKVKVLFIAVICGSFMLQSAYAQVTPLFKTIENFGIEDFYTYNKYLPVIMKEYEESYYNDYDLTYKTYKYEFTILDDELSPIRSFAINLDASTFLMDIFKDRDGDGLFPDGAYLTQTFFNNDEKVEYVLREMDNGYIKQLKIMSEDGTVLGVIPAPVSYHYDYDLNAITLGNNKYLLWISDHVDGTYDAYVYKITTNANNSISALRVSSDILAFPNPVKQQERLTITLGNTELSAGSSVQIADMNGRIVIQKPIQTQEKEVDIPTRRLSHGQYIYTVISNGQPVDSGKLIVK